MNAPEKPATLAIHQTIALAMLMPSPTNPRKRFDETKLAELAESIKSQGLLQPILVRTGKAPKKPAEAWPFPKSKAELANDAKFGETNPSDRFEIIAGERRYRAAKLAGLIEVPCFIRELTDQQVLHAQVIENLQRDDLHPIEEAEGYERLMQQDDNGNPYTAESIGAEVGKSKAYIYARLKLLALCAEARQAFFDGELDASTALLIARIPVHKLQLQALKKVTEKTQYNTSNLREGERAMSYRTARDYIQDEFMLDLDKAPFPIKDAKLLEKSGACTECQKRTGNQPELFDDVKSKDVCTDTVCFGMKKAAHILAIQKEAEAKGHAVILGKEAKKIIPQQYGSVEHQLGKAGLAALSDKIPDDEKGRTWAQALKTAKALEPAKIENPHKGGMIETVNIEEAMKALREAGFEIKPIHQDRQESSNEAFKKERAKQNALVEQSNAYRKRLFDTLHQQIEADMCQAAPHVADGLYRILAERMFDEMAGYDNAEVLARKFMPDCVEEDQDVLIEKFKEKIPTMTPQQHFLLMVAILMADEIEAHTWNISKQPETMVAIAKEIGIDAAAIEKEAVEEIKAAQKAAAAAEKKAAAKKDTKSTTEKEGATA